MSASLPPIDQSLLPADVRNGTPAHRQAYEAALGFEQVLVEQLTQSMTQTTGLDGSDGGDAATQSYAQLLPQALAQSITADGGLGLARILVPADGSADGASTVPGAQA